MALFNYDCPLKGPPLCLLLLLETRVCFHSTLLLVTGSKRTKSKAEIEVEKHTQNVGNVSPSGKKE